MTTSRIRGHREATGGLLALALLATAILLLVTSSALFTAFPEVRGNIRLAREEVLSQAGLNPPVNMLLVSTGGAARKLMAYPWVAGVQIRREWPNRLVVELKERVPYLRIQQWEMVLLLDRDGVVLGPMPQSLDLPVLIPSGQPLPGQPGGRMEDREVQTVLKTLEQMKHRQEAETVDLGEPGSAFLRWRDGGLALLGPVSDPGVLAKKLLLADNLRDQVKGPGVVADLTNAASVVVRKEGR